MKWFWTTVVLAWTGVVFAQTVELSWDASPSAEVAGYRVYYGTNSRGYGFTMNSGLVQTQRVALPRRGRWFFAVTAYDTNAMESDFSNEVQWESNAGFTNEPPRPPVLAGANVVRVCPVIERSTNLVDWAAVSGEPSFFAATNAAEFFRATRLTIERVQRVE